VGELGGLPVNAYSSMGVQVEPESSEYQMPPLDAPT